MSWQPDLPFAGEKPLAEDETSRTVALGDRIVPYILCRSRRRTIGLSIDHRGLRVGAPHRTSLTEVESLILKHGHWIAKKLDEWRSRRRPEPLKITDGMTLPLLGGSVEIRLASGNNRAFWNEPYSAAPTSEGSPVLTLCLRKPTDAIRVLEQALREKARQLFTERLGIYAERLALPMPPLTLSAARTRWGSCSSHTGIRLNWRLIHFRRHIIDYVVIHELAHIREMNHSRHFWAIVGQICPDYRTARDELKSLAEHCPHW